MCTLINVVKCRFRSRKNKQLFLYETTIPRALVLHISNAGPRSAVGNVSGSRCVSDCRSMGREFDPGPVPYFRGD